MNRTSPEGQGVKMNPDFLLPLGHHTHMLAVACFKIGVVFVKKHPQPFFNLYFKIVPIFTIPIFTKKFLRMFHLDWLV
jgi:hypothetical protein